MSGEHIDPDACTACDQSGSCPEPDCDEDCEPCGGTGECPTCEGEGTMRPYG